MNEDDTNDQDCEMKQFESVSNLENPFNQGFHLAQAFQALRHGNTKQ